MADTSSITKPDADDVNGAMLDVSLSTESPSPTLEHNESAILSLGMKSEESPPAAHDSRYGFSQVTDMAGRFEETNKMYICHLCDFRTAFRNSLLNHQAVHSDFRPWVCNVCEYAAKRKQDLKKHLHTIHGLMVESTMLKPVGVSSTIASGLLSRGESGEENSWDGIKGSKIPELDSVYTSSHFLQPTTDMLGSDMMPVAIKQERLDPSGQKPLPSMSNFITRSPPESDCDLPISFPPVVLSKENVAGHAQNMCKLSESSVRPRSYSSTPDKGKCPKDAKLSLNYSKHMSECDYSLHNFSTPRKRPRSSASDSQAHSDITQEHSTPPPKSGRMMDSDDFPCSSSVGASHCRSSQTQTWFLCEFCDIMFFQRAMYLMHAGLHSAENPWCCAVCGSSFTEKYSFTSHFINQH
ncbi:hypothetical protein BsWGS_06946 [Bradybaena similaris]